MGNSLRDLRAAEALLESIRGRIRQDHKMGRPTSREDAFELLRARAAVENIQRALDVKYQKWQAVEVIDRPHRKNKIHRPWSAARWEKFYKRRKSNYGKSIRVGDKGHSGTSTGGGGKND